MLKIGRLRVSVLDSALLFPRPVTRLKSSLRWCIKTQGGIADLSTSYKFSASCFCEDDARWPAMGDFESSRSHSSCRGSPTKFKALPGSTIPIPRYSPCVCNTCRGWAVATVTKTHPIGGQIRTYPTWPIRNGELPAGCCRSHAGTKKKKRPRCWSWTRSLGECRICRCSPPPYISQVTYAFHVSHNHYCRVAHEDVKSCPLYSSHVRNQCQSICGRRLVPSID